MAQVISASRRTDIPGFYAEWFVNRLKAGYACVQQPYSGKWSRVSLKAEDVSAVFFCSKNYRPLLSRLEQVERTTKNLFFHYTITANRELESHVPDARETVEDARYLAARYSPDHLIWRYDPVCVTDKLSFALHLERFTRLAEQLKGSLSRCIVSFAHPYRKALTNFRKYTDHRMAELAPELQREYARQLGDRAGKFGIRLYACCNDHLLSDRIGKASCIDGAYLSRLFDSPIDTRKGATRTECGCTKSADIGAYDTCAHGCLYCYANADKDKAFANQAQHDPEWNSLKMNVDEVNVPEEQKTADEAAVVRTFFWQVLLLLDVLLQLQTHRSSTPLIPGYAESHAYPPSPIWHQNPSELYSSYEVEEGIRAPRVCSRASGHECFKKRSFIRSRAARRGVPCAS